VLADRQRLKQVLLNLVANAVKYNREGGSARLSCEVHGERSRIVVQDSGPGIPEQRKHRLFTAFDRLGAEQSGVEGTGLGLALSKRLVEAMQGSLGVESVAGEGSTFYVELPNAEDPVARLGILADEPAPEVGVSPRARRFTILYVEDNLSNLTLVQRILARRSDVDLIPAMQGGLALELARSKRPDLILLDLHLPDIQGDEVLRAIRAHPDLRGTPVVVLSADATPGQVDRLIALGANAYVTKPLEVRAFIDILDGVLDARAAA
jgi:CheY-like chemotaxis protein/anti-sigma regulatory factor (Ser/Thr protein kinase)